MASFDFVKATVSGYRFTWQNRVELAKFAFPVFFIGVFCSLLIIYTGAEANALRRGLIGLPAFFAQGYFLAELVRYALFGEAFLLWGYTRRSHMEAYSQAYKERRVDKWRQSRVQGGMVLYVLMAVFNGAFLGIQALGAKEQSSVPPVNTLEPQDIPAFILESGFVLLVLLFFFWFVRVGFLYVSFSAGYGIKFYFRKLEGLYSSVPLFMCPILAVLFMIFPYAAISGLIDLAFEGVLGLRVVVSVLADEFFRVVFLSVSTVACAFGIREMLGGLPRQGADRPG